MESLQERRAWMCGGVSCVSSIRAISFLLGRPVAIALGSQAHGAAPQRGSHEKLVASALKELATTGLRRRPCSRWPPWRFVTQSLQESLGMHGSATTHPVLQCGRPVQGGDT